MQGMLLKDLNRLQPNDPRENLARRLLLFRLGGRAGGSVLLGFALPVLGHARVWLRLQRMECDCEFFLYCRGTIGSILGEIVVELC